MFSREGLPRPKRNVVREEVGYEYASTLKRINLYRSSGSSTSISVIGQEEEQEGEQNKEKVAREEKMVDSLNTSSQPMSQVTDMTNLAS